MFDFLHVHGNPACTVREEMPCIKAKVAELRLEKSDMTKEKRTKKAIVLL